MTASKKNMKELFEDPTNDERIDALVRRAPALRAKRQLQRRVASASVAMVAVLSVVAVKSVNHPPASTTASLLKLSSGHAFESMQAANSPRELQLSDGSALSVRENTAFTVRQIDGGRSVVLGVERGSLSTRLRSGRAWRFELGAGLVLTAARLPVSLELTRDEQNSTQVRVLDGVAILDQPRAQGELLRQGQQFARAGAHVELHPGETYRMVFELPQIAVRGEPATAVPSVVATRQITANSATNAVASANSNTTASANSASATAAANAVGSPHGDRSRWRSIARTGAYDLAYDALGANGSVANEATRTESAEGLWALSEVARLSGHPAEAVAPLERLLETHGSDSQAPVAAFTLGRVQLNSLHNPAAAATAFERALSLGVPSALEQNAYVLLVQARVRAGDRAAAQDAARRYRERFPNGEELNSIQHALERLR